MHKEIIEKINSADMVLVGLGEKFDYCEDSIKVLGEILADKNYYIVSMAKEKNEENLLTEKCNSEKITFPLGDNVNTTWEKYLLWLQGTLNKALVVIELDTTFKYPDVIRFPFEKTVFYNNKAQMIRINGTFYQLPKEISNKGVGIEANSKEFLKEISNNA